MLNINVHDCIYEKERIESETSYDKADCDVLNACRLAKETINDLCNMKYHY